nr:hypothetical protein PHAVU_009G167200g [Ipomoea batatas]
MVLDSPNLLSILFKLLGVMHPHPSISYIENASFKSLALSSSLPSSNNLTNSSNPSNPSGPEPILKMASWASSKDKSSPMEAMHRCSSAGDNFPSLFSSKQSNTRWLFSVWRAESNKLDRGFFIIAGQFGVFIFQRWGEITRNSTALTNESLHIDGSAVINLKERRLGELLDKKIEDQWVSFINGIERNLDH